MIALLSVFRNPSDVQGGGRRSCRSPTCFSGSPRRARSSGACSTRRTGLAASPPKSLRSTASGRRVFLVDKLQIPLLVHLAANDTDVTMEEGLQLIDALRARQPILARNEDLREARRRPPLRSPRQSDDVGAREHAGTAGLVEPRLVVSVVEPRAAE